MKKFFKAILFIFVGLLVLIGIAAIYISMRSMPTQTPEKITVKIEYTPERVEQGLKRASMLCKSCHYNTETRKFTGKFLTEVSDFGKIYSKNITAHPTAGIGNWTDGELIYFIRTGINKKGEYVPPYMPKLVNISDEDMYSIISFLRSDDERVQPDATVQPATKTSFFTNFLVTIKAFKPFPYPSKPIPGPDTTDIIKLGKYITLYQLECYSCHSADFAKNDYFIPENSFGFFGGGNEMIMPDGGGIKTLNITMHETGIGKWTEDEFVTALRSGIVPGNAPALREPMIPYANLTEKEARAIYGYLKTVPKIDNKVERKF